MNDLYFLNFLLLVQVLQELIQQFYLLYKFVSTDRLFDINVLLGANKFDDELMVQIVFLPDLVFDRFYQFVLVQMVKLQVSAIQSESSLANSTQLLVGDIVKNGRIIEWVW